MPVAHNISFTWCVLARDISHAVCVPGTKRVFAAMVLDMGNGLVLACRVAETQRTALAETCQTALASPAKPASRQRPSLVLCSPGLRSGITRAFGREHLPEIVEVAPPPQTEDVFDSFVGHMAGREQPSDPPHGEDWGLLFRGADAFYEAEPWKRWPETARLLLEVKTGSLRASFTSIVLGNGGIQCGLALAPGAFAPPAPMEPGSHPPEGTLLLTLDPPGEVPPEFRAKAVRYGWPPSSELVPVLMSLGDAAPREPNSTDARTMTIALAAVVAHDGRGLRLAGAEPRATTGNVELASNSDGAFRLTTQPAPPHFEGEDQLRLNVAGTGLISLAEGAVLGRLAAGSLPVLRARAKLHRPAPSGTACPSGEIPTAVLLAGEESGDLLAAKVAELEPLGIVIAEAEGTSMVALAGLHGSEMLMQLRSDEPALRRYHAGLKKAKGLHALLVADQASAVGAGEIYALFECLQPLPPRSPKRG